jgi:hypothetical protein
MPTVETAKASSPIIAALLAIPFAILFLSVWLAVCCSERWDKSDNKFKRYLERKKRAVRLSQRVAGEEAQV